MKKDSIRYEFYCELQKMGRRHEAHRFIATVVCIIAAILFLLWPMFHLFANDQPRIPRAYFFTAKWCPRCQPALSQLRTHATGWQIGASVRDHVQVIDIDQRADLAELHAVTMIPSVMLVDGGHNRPVVYQEPGSVYGLFK